MGIKGGHRNNNYGFGNLCNLKPVVPASSATIAATAAVESAVEEEDIDKIPNTKILRISNEIYEKLLSHNRKFYNVESYNQILDNLLRDFEEHNQDKCWRDIES